MAFFERAIHSLAKVCDRIAQAAVLAMLLLVVGNILLRIVWKPILGTYDITGFIGAILIAFAVAYCALQRGHIQVELLVERFPERVQGIIDSITGILSLGIFSLITWQCSELANHVRRVGEVSMSAHISYYPYVYGVAFGCGLLCVVILVDLIKSLVKVMKG
jgi:TRAP-type C4-dicarboxylate transport system permease small subunit